MGLIFGTFWLIMALCTPVALVILLVKRRWLAALPIAMLLICIVCVLWLVGSLKFG